MRPLYHSHKILKQTNEQKILLFERAEINVRAGTLFLIQRKVVTFHRAPLKIAPYIYWVLVCFGLDVVEIIGTKGRSVPWQ